MAEIYGIEESGNARLAFEDFGKVLKKLDFKLQPINVTITTPPSLIIYIIVQEIVQYLG